MLTQSLLAGLNKGYAQIFSTGIANSATRGGFLVPLICSDQDSSGFANIQYDYEAGVLVLTEVTDDGMQKAQNMTTKQKTVDNRTFSRLILLERAKLERNQARVYNRQFTQAGPAFALTKEKLLRQTITSGFAAGPRQIFFTSAAKKATGKDSTFTNAMTKKFSTANFDTALETLQSQTDTEGNNLGLGTDPANLHLVVGPKYRKTAANCVGAKLIGGGDENVNAGVAKLTVWGQFTGSAADHWCLFDTSVDKPGVIQNEVPVAIYTQTNPADSNVMLTGKFISQIYWRGGLDLIEPQWCFGSTGADAA